MVKIAIISPSVRKGRLSHRAALYLQNYIQENGLAFSEILDLDRYRFPLFDERLRHQKSPSPEMLDFAEKVRNSDGVIIISPEYNGGYPASLKNAIDLLYDEWQRKPVGLVSVSDGIFGGTQAVTSLQFVLWKIGVWLVPISFRIPYINKALDENGVPADKETIDHRARMLTDELLWCIKARKELTK